ncbi:MAG: SWIM zinc finger family protein [Cyanobacteria bacterium REEB67]|nr:SWIM zinc finger family protein [Cyanobacteria bacterium REEB67]
MQMNLEQTVYTSEQVLALAPDASSQKSGQDLANTRKWLKLAMGGGAAWGECQGSGGAPYQTRIDLSGPAFKCSCPSRKFPCKHGIGLLLLYSLSKASFNELEQPKWVSEWLATRFDRNKKKEKGEARDKEDDRSPEQLEEARLAKEKRRQTRLENVQAGVEELELFLADLIRQGVGNLKSEGYAFFESRAARLVDAQAPGLARLVRECAALTSGQTNWQETLLNRLATIYLITRAFKNIDQLPAIMREDVLTAVGFNQSQEAVLSGEAVADEWLVVGQYVYNEDKLRVQKSWLRGLSKGRTALILSFAHGTAPFDVLLVAGHIYDAELVFYRSNYPLRALIKVKNGDVGDLFERALRPQGVSTIDDALQEYACALAHLPWLEDLPVLINGQILVRTSDRDLFIADKQKGALPLQTNYQAGWQLTAFSAGHPLTLFGEFDGTSLKPLAAINEQNGAFLKLAQG